MTTRNLDAYYYSFEPTGCDEVDAILEQVAQAGAGYHSTADWQDKYADGSTPMSNMQRAAEESAAQIKIIISELDQLKAENEALRNTTSAAMFESVSAENKRLSALLECAQGDLKQAMQIIEKNSKDAERYRFLRRTDSWGDIDFDDHGLWIVNARDEVLNQDGEKLDAAVDAAMSKEA